MNANKQLANKINSRLDEKQNELSKWAGVIGNGSGVVTSPVGDGFVYVLMGDKAVSVFNNRVPPTHGTKVWVGYSAEEPTLFQVLSTRSEKPAGAESGYVGYAPAKRYEWMAETGGQDPLHVHLRAISFLKVGASRLGGMYANIGRGRVWSGARFINVAQQDINLTAHIPASASMAAFVLITIDNSGAVVQTKGAEVDIHSLMEVNRPAVPSGTAFVCGCVRVYNGQTALVEARNNTDFDDLRFAGHGGSATQDTLFMVTEDLTAQIDGVVSHFTISAQCIGLPMIYCNIRQLPSAFTMDAGGAGFTLSYVPTIYDHLIVDYQTRMGALLFDGSGDALFDGNNNYLFDI